MISLFLLLFLSIPVILTSVVRTNCHTTKSRLTVYRNSFWYVTIVLNYYEIDRYCILYYAYFNLSVGL